MILKPYVKITGSGPALVLLHGWGLHGGIWETVLEKLEENFTVHNVDMPGFGHSSVHNGEYTLDYLVDSIETILPEKCFLLGWSLGGLVATALSLKCPEKIKKLITVASNNSIKEALSILTKNDISQLPVMQDGRIVGSINENLIYSKIIDQPEIVNKEVNTIMQEALPFVDSSTPLDVLAGMVTKADDAVLVKDFKHNNTYIITRYDVVQALAL